MDALDVRILCAVAFPRTGWPDTAEGRATVAHRLRVDEKTVRSRLRRLESEGFIKYYQATPNFDLLGMPVELTDRMEAMNIVTKLRALRDALGRPGTIEAYDFLGPTFQLTVAGATREAAAGTLRSVAERYELARVPMAEHRTPAPGYLPSLLDWRIVAQMRYDARVDASELARQLGITGRIVRYRLRRLTRSGAIIVRPVIDPQRQQGLVFYRLTVTVEPGSQAAVLGRLQELFAESIWDHQMMAEGPLRLDLFSFTLGGPEAAVETALGIDGVRSCSALTLKEIREPPRPSWIDRWIADIGRGSPSEPGSSGLR